MKDTDCIDCAWASNVVTAGNDNPFYSADCNNPDAMQEARKDSSLFKNAAKSLTVNREKRTRCGYVGCKYWEQKQAIEKTLK